MGRNSLALLNRDTLISSVLKMLRANAVPPGKIVEKLARSANYALSLSTLGPAEASKCV